MDPRIEKLLKGDKPALARVISRIENRAEDAPGLLHELYSHQHGVPRVGITGPPGAGKSTLVAHLIARWRKQDLKVGVVAVDPTSPFSGGAVLGDRVRMHEVAMDSGVFIRSMATRGSLGGLSSTSREVCEAMDASGMDRILIETVGVGQSELDVARAADSIAVVVVPESGDSIQALKAGLMEIADVFVVNKSDREGADRMVGDLEGALSLKSWRDRWKPVVVKAVAFRGEGVAEVDEALERHRQWLEESGQLQVRRRESIRARLLELVREEVGRQVQDSRSPEAVDQLVGEVLSGRYSPYRAAQEWTRGWIPRAGA